MARGCLRVETPPLRKRKGRKPDSVLIAIYLMRPVPATRTTRAASRGLFGLAPGGVFRAAGIAADAVSSYLAFSPLPRLASRRYIFCGTVRCPVITTEHPGLRRVPRPMESGLSSLAVAGQSGYPPFRIFKNQSAGQNKMRPQLSQLTKPLPPFASCANCGGMWR